MPTEVSINLPPFALERMGALARAAENAGFHAARVGDMQSTHREMYTALTVMAAATTHIRFGPGVTNPVTRHPAVAASAIASLHEYSGGRAVFGVGAGDSAVHNLGAAPATIAGLEEYIRAVRDLHETGRARFRDHDLVLDWWQGGPIPIAVSAHGPRTLRLAGRVADAVVVGLGMGERAREYAAEHIAAGAREAGRDPESIDVWHLAYLNVGADGDETARQVGSALAVAANLLARSAARDIIPDSLRPRLDELAARYSYLRHAGAGDAHPNAALIDGLGLREHLLQEFGVVGTPREVRRRLDDLAADGVTRVWGAYVLPDLDDFFARWKSAASDTREDRA